MSNKKQLQEKNKKGKLSRQDLQYLGIFLGGILGTVLLIFLVYKAMLIRMIRKTNK